MKKSLLFLLFLVFSTLLAAQQTPRIEQLVNQKRRETYVNRFGYDSMRYTILLPHDTLLTEKYYLSGHIDTKTWTNDSVHVFDNLGRLREIYYAHDKVLIKPNYNTSPDIRYYFNGEVEERFKKTPTGNVTDVFKRNGEFVYRTVWQQVAPTIEYKIQSNKQGSVVSANKIDTVLITDSTKTYITYDTAFYPNGRLFYISHDKKTELFDQYAGREGLMSRYYNPNGTLNTELLPDSLNLIPFKDNVDCYYGLKNKRGDTIYPARFDHIEDFCDDFWLTHQGVQVALMRKDGKMLSHVPMNDVYSIRWIEPKDFSYSMRNNDAYLLEMWSSQNMPKQYFGFVSDGKHGIIDRNGLVVIPPQYSRFDGVDASGSLFAISVKDKTSRVHLTEHIIDRKGNYVPNNKYPSITFTNVPNFFAFSKTSPADTSRWQYEGLMNQAGDVLLEDVYVSIFNAKLSTDNKLLWVKKGKESHNYIGEKDFSNEIYGLYDPEHRRWMLPCIYKINENSNWPELVLTDTFTKKSGIASRSGELILPIVYDKIDHFYGANICLVSKNGQYQVYDITRRRLDKEIYQNLVLDYLTGDYVNRFSSRDLNSNSCSGPVTPLIIAQKNGKWGILDLNGKISLPLTYDYAGESNARAFVKNNEADIIASMFFPDPKHKLAQGYDYYDYERLLTTYKLINGDRKQKQQFVVDSLRHVLLPPQYESVQSRDAWEILQNKDKERLILFKDIGKVEPFPYLQRVQWAASNVPIMVLHTVDYKGFEIHNRRTRQVYQKVDGGAVAIADRELGTYFVKTDTPNVDPIKNNLNSLIVCADTFLIDDSNWRMYDSTGKSLTTNVFRYPILFNEGIGIGTVADKFGVWRLDGSTVIPPQYENARWTMDYERIVAYENRGLKTWLLLFDRAGKTLVNGGRYDGISRFYGKYALVSLGDKTGLIDSSGIEIIAPTSLDNDRFNLIDSLNIFNIEYAKMMKKRDITSSSEYLRMPISIHADKKTPTHPDSLALPNALRNRLWHYLLQTQVEAVIQQADFKSIKRGHAFKTYNVSQERCHSSGETNALRHVFADSLHISFALLSDSAAKSNFTNYWKTKSGWERQQLSDILILNRDNILKINALMTEKLRQLADKSIDCGESTSFIERTRNTFLTTPTGLNFYFTSNERDVQAWNLTNYIPIHLTWSELKPFRTPQ